MRYIWMHPSWPRFSRSAETLLSDLGGARRKQGLLLGTMRQIGFDLQLQAQAEALVEDAVKTSAIEGETLDLASVRSSVARRLGLPDAAARPLDRRAEGVVDMLLDATRRHSEPLSAERLFGWHAALFPTGYSGLRRIEVGRWRSDRDDPMQVVSGPMHRPFLHFEAPPASRVPAEMERFLNWLNGSNGEDGLLRAAVAHLWFVTIHPFEDGNGRIARAISDLVLARDEGMTERFYSVSSQIMRERKTYYAVLERTQKTAEDAGTGLDITEWTRWFLGCFARAVDQASDLCADTLRKARFWRRHADKGVSERQNRVLNRYLDGFEGKLTAAKWAVLTKTSPDTALRDIGDLIDKGVLRRSGAGGRSTSYLLVEADEGGEGTSHPRTESGGGDAT